MSLSDQQKAEDWFHVLATHYVEVQALMHLSQVGALTALFHASALSADDLAERCGLEASVLTPLLDYLVDVDEMLIKDAEGRYALTEIGFVTLRRYGREGGDGRMRFNMFDVRAGAYGPVWASLAGLMQGELTYGVDVHRSGERSEDGLVKVGGRLSRPLGDHLESLGATIAVEIGVAAQLVHAFATDKRPWRNVGLDRNPRILERVRISAGEQGLNSLSWVEGDFFEPERWASIVGDRAQPGVLFTLHGHELLALGRERFKDGLGKLAECFPGWHLVLIEQPRLLPEQRASISTSRWLYSASNVLIHHLIGNGVILTHQGWLDLLAEAGCQCVAAPALSYLDYRAYTTKLWGG